MLCVHPNGYSLAGVLVAAVARRPRQNQSLSRRDTPWTDSIRTHTISHPTLRRTGVSIGVLTITT